eukprot:gene3468-4357_t
MGRGVPSFSETVRVQRYTLLEVLRDSLLDFDLPSAVHAVVAISATGGQLQAHVAHRAKDTDVSSITLRTENEGLLAGLELLLIAKGGAKRTDGTQQANVSLTQAVLHYRTLEYNSIRPLIDGVQLQHERAAFLLEASPCCGDQAGCGESSAAGSVEDAEVEELRQLGQLYLSALRLDPSNDFALRQVAQLNARDVVPADAFAGVLAEHLDICPASGQAWRSLAELLPTICHDQAMVATRPFLTTV